jgi:glutamate-1-semialdehyde 2,1-aminomutase
LPAVDLRRRAADLFPGGVNSPVRAFRSVGAEPIILANGEGARVRDVDGRAYIDYIGGWGPAILGHRHPAVVTAITDQATRGFALGLTGPLEILLAERIRERMPSIERLRFTSSGTEAVMSAVRLARAATGRELVVKFAGGYHGHSDGLLVEAGSGLATQAIPGSAGVPAAVAAGTIVLPYNDPAAVAVAFRTHQGRIAAVIVEPVAANVGVIAPVPDFLEALRELTARDGALLVFDEVITGFRVARGGAQARFGIRPDLTTLGKIIGGGYPLAAFGGRSDVMDIFDQRRTGAVSHGGTFNGSPVAAAAGLATLRELTPETYIRLDALGGRLRSALVEVIARDGLDARVATVGSLFQVFSGEGVTAFATGVSGGASLFLGMLLEGFYLAPRGMGAIPAIADESDIDDLAAAVGRVLVALDRVREPATA